jgi:hypothetical protein
MQQRYETLHGRVLVSGWGPSIPLKKQLWLMTERL